MFVAPIVTSDLISDTPNPVSDTPNPVSDAAAAPQPTTTRTPALPQGAGHVRSGRSCPCCGAASSAWRPIRYGMVAASVLAQARRGEVVLGSVNYGRNEPQWACTACDARFGRPREDRDRFGRPLETAGEAERAVEVLEPAALRRLARAARQGVRRRVVRRRAA